MHPFAAASAAAAAASRSGGAPSRGASLAPGASLVPGASMDMALLNLASSASTELHYRRAESLLPCGWVMDSGGWDSGGCQLGCWKVVACKHGYSSCCLSHCLPRLLPRCCSLTKDELHELLGRLGDSAAPKSNGGRQEGGAGGRDARPTAHIGGGVTVTAGGAGGGEAPAGDERMAG